MIETQSYIETQNVYMNQFMNFVLKHFFDLKPKIFFIIHVISEKIIEMILNIEKLRIPSK